MRVCGWQGGLGFLSLVSVLQSVSMVSWKYLLAACRGFPGQQNKERLTPCKTVQQVFPGAEVETLDPPKLTESVGVPSLCRPVWAQFGVQLLRLDEIL